MRKLVRNRWEKSSSLLKTFSIFIAVFLGLSMVSATAENTTADITACINKNTGSVRISQICSPRETPFQWLINGLTGKQGPRGSQILGAKDAAELTSKNIGEIGDFVITTSDSILFGPKTATGWPKVGTKLQGAIGPQGIAGLNGATGATGATGAQGPGGSGPAGTTGATGTTGSAGTPGVKIAEQSVCDGPDAGTVADELCKIGMVGPGGGYIFFIDYMDQYADFNYLEAAPADSSASIVWCNTSTSLGLNGWDKSAVGRGQLNTTVILAGCSTGAARSADAYFTATKTDWFLGSSGEMMLMYTNLRQAGVGGLASGSYWSSSEVDGGDHGWTQIFSYGYQEFSSKGNSHFVRPVRSF